MVSEGIGVSEPRNGGLRTAINSARFAAEAANFNSVFWIRVYPLGFWKSMK